MRNALLMTRAKRLEIIMTKRGTPLLMISAAFLFSTAGCLGTSVQPGERGLLWHPLTAGLEKEPLKDGFYWTAPWNDVYRYDVRWQSYSENVDAWSADDLQVVVKAAIILRPIPQDVYHLAQTVGTDYYMRVVKPEFLAAVRSVVSEYTVVTVPEKSVEIAKKVQAVVEDKLKDSHLSIQSVAVADVDFPQIVLTAIEQKQAKEQEKEQKEFELLIANKDADIARARAKGEGDATQILAEGQAKAQETITKTLTPEYLRYKLYGSQNSKMVLLPDNLKLPILLNPGEQQSMKEEEPKQQSAQLPSSQPQAKK
jgi:regulator of protease activity HflC (stomatin/prohibitin superfamily)